MLDEEQGAAEEQGGQGDGQEGAQSNAEANFASREEFEALKSQNEQMMQMLQMLTQKPKAPEKPAVELTADEQAAIQADPGKIGKIVEQKLSQATKVLTDEQKKSTWDRKAYDEFPALNTDKKFQQDVLAQARELMVSDGLSDSHPMLVYRAAQLVAAKRALSGAGTQTQTRGNMATSADPALARPRPSGGQSKIDDNDPRLVAARTIGLSDEQVARLKKNLGPYQPPQRKQGRTLTRERS